MNTCKSSFELIYPEDFDARAELEAQERGLLDYVRVRLQCGLIYDLCFFTPERLAREFELIHEVGEICIADPSLIVVQAITRADMERAVCALVSTSYFNRRVHSLSID